MSVDLVEILNQLVATVQVIIWISFLCGIIGGLLIFLSRNKEISLEKISNFLNTSFNVDQVVLSKNKLFGMLLIIISVLIFLYSRVYL